MTTGEVIAPCQSDASGGTVRNPTGEDVYTPGSKMDIVFRTWPLHDIELGREYVWSIFLQSLHDSIPNYTNITVLGTFKTT